MVDRRAYVGPSVKFHRKPSAIVEHNPKNYRDEKRKGNDSGVQEAMQGL